MSKGGGSSTSTVEQKIDPDVKAAYLTNLDNARDVANQLGERQFAGLNPQYETGETMAMNTALGGVGTQNLNTAADLTRVAAGYSPLSVGYDQSMIDQYMNPYTNEVINNSVADLERARQSAVQQMGQRATAAKAFGGSRQGVAEALTNREYGTQAGTMISNLRSQGFNNAVQNAMQAQLANQAAGLQGAQFRLGAANQLGAQGLQQQASGYADAAKMMQLGQTRQAAAQQQLDAERNLGMERLGIMQGALGLQPANLGGTTTQPLYQNTGASLLGGALGGAQLGGMLGLGSGAGAGLGALLALI